MKGLILSGGKGTRLRPLTYTSAKQLVPVANKPVLFYGIESIVEAGIRDVAIIVGETGAEIRAAVGDGERFGARITYIEQDAPRGLAHAVMIAEEFMAGDPFVMYLGDNLIAGGITSLVDEFRDLGCNAEILLAEVPNPQQFGVAELAENGKVRRLVEKPPEPRSNLALVGVYMFDHHVFESVHRIRPSARGELEITDAIQDMVECGLDVHPHVVRGWWKDTGKLEDMLEANRIVLETMATKRRGDFPDGSRVEGRVELGEGVTIVDSLIRGPVVIGDGVRIEHAFVGPYTAIGDGCTIVRCEIENSIVMEGSELRDVPMRVDGSLLGRNVRIVKTDFKPRAYRFMLGDNSEVGIT
ncbi:MAG TPA: glucose-1-phosphate thymidylyltransferase [Thermoanaerobaculia bacterium]|nr:glucose-1-phosphate thymidylyltransferase [Thermoanaerobaculia bacterium]